MRPHSSVSAPTTAPRSIRPALLDQDVQPSESLDAPLYSRLGLASVGDVRFHDQRGPARLADLGRERFQTVPTTGHERDGGTFLGEPSGGGGADATACTGDKGRGAGQFRRHGVLSSLLGYCMAVMAERHPWFVRRLPARRRRV